MHAQESIQFRQCMLMKIMTMFCLGATLAPFGPVLPATAGIITVPTDQPTIQGGIDAAQEGDTVLVSPGTYVENINFMGKRITVRSISGPELTVIDGSQPADPLFGSVVTFNHQEDRLTVLDGFSITGGTGMFYVSGSPYYQEYYGGGGIFCNRASPAIINNIIHDNTPTNVPDGTFGGGILCYRNSSPVIKGNQIIGNSAMYGAGIMCLDQAEPAISKNRICGNQGYWGGGIYLFGQCRPVLLENTITTNTANNGGGILMRGVSHARLRGNRIMENTAEDGGGISLTNCFPHVVNCLLAGNEAQVGGGMTCYAISEPAIINCTFYGNTASVRGGGMEIAYQSRPKVANSIFWDNQSALGPEVNFSPHTLGPPELHISYTNLQDGPRGLGKCDECIIHWGPGMINADPLFCNGPEGNFYLSQTTTRQIVDSPSLGAGDPYGISLWATTCTNGKVDDGITDQGFHYPVRAGITAGSGTAEGTPPLVRALQVRPDENCIEQFTPYSVVSDGVHTACGDIDGDLMDEIVCGPGTGDGGRAHIRGFLFDGTQLYGLSFLAYQTPGNGVHVATGDLNGNWKDEIITAPVQGFGSRVRAFSYDRYAEQMISPVKGVDFRAYSTMSGGVHVAAGDIDGDGMDEIITGAGPQSWLGPHVRGWDVEGGIVEAIPAVDYMAYFWTTHGVAVSAGDFDGDGIDELVTAPGPDSRYGAMIVGWIYDGSTIGRAPGCACFVWPPSEVRFGAHLSSGSDFDGDGRDEIVVGGGPDPGIGSPVVVLEYNGSSLVQTYTFEAMPAGYSAGATVSMGRYGGFLPLHY